MEGYGQTEMTVAVAVFPVDEPKPGSMGLPSPGYDIDLMDDDGKALRGRREGRDRRPHGRTHARRGCSTATTATPS